jgi:uncharacterized alkaline shock family protein YloU
VSEIGAGNSQARDADRGSQPAGPGTAPYHDQGPVAGGGLAAGGAQVRPGSSALADTAPSARPMESAFGRPAADATMTAALPPLTPADPAGPPVGGGQPDGYGSPPRLPTAESVPAPAMAAAPPAAAVQRPSMPAGPSAPAGPAGPAGAPPARMQALPDRAQSPAQAPMRDDGYDGYSRTGAATASDDELAVVSAPVFASEQAAGPPLAAIVKGRVQIEDEVVEKVAGLAAVEVDGVADLGGNVARALESVREHVGIGHKRATQGVRARIEDRQVAIHVTLVIEYGAVVMEVARAVKANVARAVSHMLGLRVVEVNVTVDDVSLPHRAPQGAHAADTEHAEDATAQ